jgi:nucleoside-diphosphate-sugar epimerase
VTSSTTPSFAGTDLGEPAQTIVITGAAGRIGTALAPLLRRPGRRLRLVDRVPSPPDGEVDDSTWHVLDIVDEEGLRQVFRGANAVIHLAGIPREAAWKDILDTNVTGTHRVLEAARRAGVRRILLASSVHAVGYATPADAGGVVGPPRPDTYYGWSKAAVESLGSLYADRYGMTVVSARICTFQPEPRDDGRTPALWLSPEDAARLAEASIALDDGAHHIVWGVSANSPAWVSLDAGRAIGFEPVDDAVDVLGEAARRSTPTRDAAPALGGVFTDPRHPLGSTW